MRERDEFQTSGGTQRKGHLTKIPGGWWGGRVCGAQGRSKGKKGKESKHNRGLCCRKRQKKSLYPQERKPSRGKNTFSQNAKSFEKHDTKTQGKVQGQHGVERTEMRKGQLCVRGGDKCEEKSQDTPLLSRRLVVFLLLKIGGNEASKAERGKVSNQIPSQKKERQRRWWSERSLAKNIENARGGGSRIPARTHLSKISRKELLKAGIADHRGVGGFLEIRTVKGRNLFGNTKRGEGECTRGSWGKEGQHEALAKNQARVEEWKTSDFGQSSLRGI